MPASAASAGAGIEGLRGVVGRVEWVGGEQDGGDDSAEQGDTGGDEAADGEPVEERAGCGRPQLVGGGAEARIGDPLGGDERAADRLACGVRGLGGEAAREARGVLRRATRTRCR